MTCSYGTQARLLIEPGASDHTFDSSSEAYEFKAENLVCRHLVIRDAQTNLRGTRSQVVERVAQGIKVVGGWIRMNPSTREIDRLLPRILGAAESSDSFALDDTLPTFGVLIDRVGETFEYQDCYINRAIFRSRENGLLELLLEIFGTDEATGTTFPASPEAIDSLNLYTMTQGVLTAQSSARNFNQFVLDINNHIGRTWNNSRTATCLVPADRTITLSTSTPFDSTYKTLFTTPVTSAAGAAGTLVFTNGSNVLTFTFANLNANPVSPSVPGRSEIRLPLNYDCLKSSTTNELVVTNVLA